MGTGIRFFCASALSLFVAVAVFVPNSARAQTFVEAPDLEVRIRAPESGCIRGRGCRFVVSVDNRGEVSFGAPIHVRHDVEPYGMRFSETHSPDWFCLPRGDRLDCSGRRSFLAPGRSVRYSVNVHVPADARRRRLRVCAEIDWRRPDALAERVRAVQRVLQAEGYSPGSPDGVAGPVTRDAVARFQIDEGLPVTGRIDRTLVGRLVGDWGVGDARAHNDGQCVPARLLDGGPFERSADPDRADPGGPGLLCPPRRIQRGRECVCGPGLTESATGACLPDDAPVFDSGRTDPGGPRLLCPPRRIQRGRECVCGPGLTESVTGVCRPDRARTVDPHRVDDGGPRLRCPPRRIQRGRECVCGPGLTESVTGACLPDPAPRIESEPEVERRTPSSDVPACGPGRRRTAAGGCECRAGEVERDGECVAVGSPPPECSGVWERDRSGRCVCPRGLEEIDGLCRLPRDETSEPVPVERPEKPSEPSAKPAESSRRPAGKTCGDGMTLNEDGECRCYLDLEDEDGKCFVRVRTACLPGEIRNVRGKCECPKGREIRDGECVPGQN